jgi:hemolysin activation/secretion protein
MKRFVLFISASTLGLIPSGGAQAQVPLDQADPAYIEDSLTAPAAVPSAPAAPPTQIDAERTAPATPPAGVIVVRAIEVTGNTIISGDALTELTRPYVGRSLTREDLRQLAAAVGGAARQRGFPFASATVRQDPAKPESLVVELDEGQVTAVRLLGATNAAADRILQRLVTGRPVTTNELERAILLAGDVPGVRIVSSRYMRQDGFGILFVEAKETRSSLYAQLDNRGSDAVGPLRSTVLGSVRSIITPGDQVSIIAAQTPANPKEFMFARLRYDIPADDQGAVVTFSGSAGRINPGASLRRLDVIGHSQDVAIAYQRPLLRRRSASLWANVELRRATSDQALRGDRIRDDNIATLTGTISGEADLAGGRIRGDTGIVWGLPIKGVTRRGDRLASRSDGSGRAVIGHAWLEWSRTVTGPISLRLSAEGQLASRPLLAAMELGAGGPAFGRAFDYGERTGDQGILGSAELGVQLPKPTSWRPIRSLQLYGFADGGYVDNLDDGFGGGSLASAGGGVRMSFARISFGLEAAAPLNTDRLDTGDRGARITLRTAAQF